jgi:hypothetical protein
MRERKKYKDPATIPDGRFILSLDREMPFRACCSFMVCRRPYAELQ